MSAAVQDWFAVHDAYHKASAAYNERLRLVRAERERGNWSMDVNAEYQALNNAQKAALSADDALYRFLKATAEQEARQRAFDTLPDDYEARFGGTKRRDRNDQAILRSGW